MEFTSSIFESYFEKLFVLISTAAIIGLLKYCNCLNQKTDEKPNSRRNDILIMDELRKAKTVEDVQKLIEELPCECSEEDLNSVNLRDLMGDLINLSEDDEDLRSLVMSVVCGVDDIYYNVNDV